MEMVEEESLLWNAFLSVMGGTLETTKRCLTELANCVTQENAF